MESVLDSQVYRLYVCSVTGFPGLINNTDKANVSWLIDYDVLFNRENYKYENCRLRYRFFSHPGTIANISHVTNNGVLVANGLNSRHVSKNTSALVLDNVTPTTSSSHGWFQISSMDEVGLDIIVPYGLSSLNIQLWDGAFGAPTSVLQNFPTDYTLILAFELYNPK